MYVICPDYSDAMQSCMVAQIYLQGQIGDLACIGSFSAYNELSAGSMHLMFLHQKQQSLGMPSLMPEGICSHTALHIYHSY